MPVRIVLVDDHLMFREAVREVINAQSDLRVVGEAGDASSTYTVVEHQKPDLVVLDLALPGPSGLAVARELRRHFSHARLLVTSGLPPEDALLESLAVGALGFLGKGQSCTALVDAVRAVASGRQYISCGMNDEVIEAFLRRRANATRTPHPLKILTPREREIFDLLVQGLTNPEMAAQLRISPRTIETHRAHLLEKLNVRSAADLIRFAARNGLLGESGRPALAT